jgi:hypothetical protein
MTGSGLALRIAVVAVAIAGLFVVYAVSGADLCIWCDALGR